MKEYPKCCGSCQAWFNSGMVIGICEDADKSKEVSTCGGDGKDCEFYRVLTNEEEWQRRLSECR